MPKEPLFPHVHGKREPLFPHVTKSQGADKLPGKGGRFVIDTDRMGNIIITHTERPGDVFLQFESDKDLVYDILKKPEREDLDKGWKVEIKGNEVRASMLQELWDVMAEPEKLPSVRRLPQTLPFTPEQYLMWKEKFEAGYGQLRPGVSSQQVEAEIAAIPDVIRQTYIAAKYIGREKLHRGSGISPQTLERLASTEGDPIRKFCCRLCGECAPKGLLEEGRFLDRISWLRSHYKEKHPGMWGKMSPMTVEDGELVSPEYRHLVGLVSEPLPPEAE